MIGTRDIGRKLAGLCLSPLFKNRNKFGYFQEMRFGSFSHTEVNAPEEGYTNKIIHLFHKEI